MNRLPIPHTISFTRKSSPFQDAHIRSLSHSHIPDPSQDDSKASGSSWSQWYHWRQNSTNVRPCVAENPTCRKIKRISTFTSLCINRTRVMNLLLTLNIKSFCCGWFKENVAEKNPRSLQSHWSFPANRVFRHSGTDVTWDVRYRAIGQGRNLKVSFRNSLCRFDVEGGFLMPGCDDPMGRSSARSSIRPRFLPRHSKHIVCSAKS